MVCSWGAFRTKWSLYVVFLPLFCKMNTLSGIKFIAEYSSVKNETSHGDMQISKIASRGYAYLMYDKEGKKN